MTRRAIIQISPDRLAELIGLAALFPLYTGVTANYSFEAERVQIQFRHPSLPDVPEGGVPEIVDIDDDWNRLKHS